MEDKTNSREGISKKEGEFRVDYGIGTPGERQRRREIGYALNQASKFVEEYDVPGKLGFVMDEQVKLFTAYFAGYILQKDNPVRDLSRHPVTEIVSRNRILGGLVKGLIRRGEYRQQAAKALFEAAKELSNVYKEKIKAAFYEGLGQTDTEKQVSEEAAEKAVELFTSYLGTPREILFAANLLSSAEIDHRSSKPNERRNAVQKTFDRIRVGK